MRGRNSSIFTFSRSIPLKVLGRERAGYYDPLQEEQREYRKGGNTMNLTRRLKRMLAMTLSISLLFSGVLVGTASAAVVDTDTVIEAQQQQYDREQLKALLDDEQVQKKLTALGVDKAEVEQRIDAMTPAELAQLNDHMDSMPAGGSVLGVLLVIFLVFVITDVIGATDIFPFIHPVN